MVDMDREVRTYSHDESLVDKRRGEIVICASSVFLKKGFDRTSMNELAKAFGMSKGGLYHYIGSKEDILYLIIKFNKEKQKEFIKDMQVKTAGMNPVETLRVAIEGQLDRLDKYQDMYIFLVAHVLPNLSKTERQSLFEDSLRLTGFFEHLIKGCMESGDATVDDTWLAASMIVGMSGRWTVARWSLRQKYTLEEYKKTLVALIFRSLGIAQVSMADVKVTGCRLS